MKLEDIIKTYRSEHGMSQRRFGELCGLSNGYVCQLEKGVHPKTGEPLISTIPTLKRIAEGMGISLDDLFKMLDNDKEVAIVTEERDEIHRLIDSIPEDKLLRVKSMILLLMEDWK